jgi:hypothetical protein
MATQAALQHLLRRALMMRAKADAPLIALVPPTSINPDGEPVWPFVQFDVPRTQSLRLSCVNGATAQVDAHLFAGPRIVAGLTVETGYDHASRCAAALEAAISGLWIDLEDGSHARLRLSDTQMLRDAEPDAWHWFGQINARVLAE